MARRFYSVSDDCYDAIIDASIGLGEAFQDAILSRANAEGWSDLEREALAYETTKQIQHFFKV